MWAAFVNFIWIIIDTLNNTLAEIGIPYSFGFAIILFTVLIKVVTYPLNQKQIESTRATQELQPKLKELQKKYAKDKEKLSKAQMELYKEAGVNPMGGCFPMLIQMPIWFGLYRAIYQHAIDLAGPFLWIPDLAGPVADRAQGLSWLYPFVDGAPSVGWAAAIAYLVLPILLVVSQLYTQKMMTPKSDDPTQKSMGQAMMFMPFMFGYFALVVPSGLTLYWFTNNILTMLQQKMLNTGMDKKQAKKAADKQNGNLIVDGKSTLLDKPAKNLNAPEVSNGNGADVDEQVKNDDEKPSAKSARPKSKRKRKK